MRIPMEKINITKKLFTLTLWGFAFSAGWELTCYYTKHVLKTDQISRYILFSGLMYLMITLYLLVFENKKPLLMIIIPLYAYLGSSNAFWCPQSLIVVIMQLFVIYALIVLGHGGICIYLVKLKARPIRSALRLIWLLTLILQTIVFIVLVSYQNNYRLSRNLLNTAWVYMILLIMCQSIDFLNRRFKVVSRFLIIITPLLIISSAISAYGLGSTEDLFLTTIVCYIPNIIMAVTAFLYSLWLNIEDKGPQLNRLKTILTTVAAFVIGSTVMFLYLKYNL